MSRVIVVDDSKVIRKSASKMLGAEFDVVTAEDGEDGWAQIQRDESIQVVFTDLMMPGINGYELLRDIRTAADARIRSLPVIVVTGIEDDEVARVRALELGATDFITKPFTTIDLLARARAHASHQRETSELRAQTTLDTLTGLANKVGFLDRLQQDMAYARRHRHELTLVRLEIDDFRAIFLQRGKEVGERLLAHIAKLLRAAIRKEDTAGRVSLGGFALSLPAGEPHGVEHMVERVRAEIAGEWTQIVGGAFPAKLSVGIFAPPLETGMTAPQALDECQKKLSSSGAPANATVVAAPVAVPPLAAAPASHAAPIPVPAAQRAAAPAPLRIDPLLDQIDRGNPQPAIAGMPLILRRLMPALKLLNPNQRGTLIRFLQQP